MYTKMKNCKKVHITNRYRTITQINQNFRNFPDFLQNLNSLFFSLSTISSFFVYWNVLGKPTKMNRTWILWPKKTDNKSGISRNFQKTSGNSLAFVDFQLTDHFVERKKKFIIIMKCLFNRLINDSQSIAEFT